MGLVDRGKLSERLATKLLFLGPGERFEHSILGVNTATVNCPSCHT